MFMKLWNNIAIFVFRVLSTKLEVKLRKGEGVRWNALEGDGAVPLPGGAVPTASAAGGVKAPYASGRDWNKVNNKYLLVFYWWYLV